MNNKTVTHPLDQVIDYIRKTKEEYKWEPKSGDFADATGSNVFCGYMDDKLKIRHDMYPCHKPINGYKNAAILWSSFGARTKCTTAKAFREWLCLKSPWNTIGAVPGEILRDDKDFDWPEGFIFTELNNQPANRLHNFLVASRMAAEWPGHIQAWHDLIIKHDVDPTFAFMFLTVFQPINDGGRDRDTWLDAGKVSSLAFKDKYDWPLDMARCGEEYVVNFLTANPVGISKAMFSPNAVTAPVNTLWGPVYEPKDREKRYTLKLYQLYGSRFGRPRAASEGVSKFRLYEKEREECDKPEFFRAFESKEIIEICKLEQERLWKEFNIARN